MAGCLRTRGVGNDGGVAPPASSLASVGSPAVSDAPEPLAPPLLPGEDERSLPTLVLSAPALVNIISIFLIVLGLYSILGMRLFGEVANGTLLEQRRVIVGSGGTGKCRSSERVSRAPARRTSARPQCRGPCEPTRDAPHRPAA